MAACCSCLEGLSSMLAPPGDKTQEDQDMFDLLHFLSRVPLFKKQLSPADLPDIAHAMKQHVFRPGETVVKQGQHVKAFFLIKSGSALAIFQSAVERSSAVTTELQPGDFFGAKALLSHEPMLASICASGEEPLVVLAISRQKFEELGLHKKMTFHPRPALDISARPREAVERRGARALTDEEVESVVKAIKANPNLQMLLASTKCDAHDVARLASVWEVQWGEEVCRAGEIAHDFVVVHDGSLIGEEPGSVDSGARSAETAVLSVARLEQRMKMKADMIRSLAKGSVFKCSARRTMTFGSKSNDSGSPTSPGSLPRSNSFGQSEGNTVFQVGDVVHIMEPLSPGSWSRGPWTPTRGKNPTSPKGSSGDLLRRPSLASLASDFDMSPSGSTRGGLAPDEGVVVGVAESEVTVFNMGRTRKVKSVELRKVRGGMDGSAMQDLKSLQVKRGETLGEMSLLYNAQMTETYTAEVDSVVFAISRHDFKRFFKQANSHKDEELQEWATLLDDVTLLETLVHQQREELARNATGRVHFDPGEAVVTQGSSTGESPQWYIVEKGEAIVSQRAEENGPSEEKELATLHRAQHFGGRAVLRGTQKYDMTVRAGAGGLTCLAIDRSILQELNLDDTILASSKDENVTASEYFAKMVDDNHHSQDAEAREIEMDSLDTVKLLGRGAYGAVSLVRDRMHQKVYALKKMSIGSIVGAEMQHRIVSEREIMATMDSPFVMKFYRSFRDSQHVYFLLEVASGGDLLNLLHGKREVLSTGITAQAFYIGCAALALEHLHSHRIIYRDLKPENVILSDTGYAKLCDFGFSRFCYRKTHTRLGTPDYMAPEIIDVPHRHDHMVDWWALGVMMFELFAGRTPFGTDDDDDVDPNAQLMEIRRAQSKPLPLGQLPGSCSIEAKEVMKGLMKANPASRMCARGPSELLGHKMFKMASIDIEALRRLEIRPPFTPKVADFEGCPALDVRPDAVDASDEIFVQFDGDASHERWLKSF